MTKELSGKLDRIEKLLEAEAIKPMTFEEAAKYLHISKSYLYRLTSQSESPHYKPGGKKIFFDKQDLDRYLLKNRVASKEELSNIAARFQTPSSGNRSHSSKQTQIRKG